MTDLVSYADDIGMYVELRERKRKLTKLYEARLAQIEKVMDGIEAKYRVILRESEASLSTKKGVAYPKTLIKVRLDDLEELQTFILEAPEERLQLLEKRVAQGECKTLAEEMGIVKIPGTRLELEEKVIFTKPTSTKSKT